MDRAVESPNFHSYLQAAPTATPFPGPGDAYLLSANTAGQFQIAAGQLVYYTGAGSSPLYMQVENPTNKTQRTLETWFSNSQNTYGSFAFQGDTLTWTVSDISRPNAAAWYVCGDAGQLYINTGAYAYDTPAGCVDETVGRLGKRHFMPPFLRVLLPAGQSESLTLKQIHSYGGSTANV